MKKEPAVILYASSLGVYIPQFFAESCAEDIWKVNEDDLENLRQGPDGEYYSDLDMDMAWEAWKAAKGIEE